jgi:hypothetical protein
VVRGRRRLRRAPAADVVEHLQVRTAPRLVGWLAVRDVGVHEEVAAAILELEPLVRGQPGLHPVYVRRSRLRNLLRRQRVPTIPATPDVADETTDDLRRESAYAIERLARAHPGLLNDTERAARLALLASERSRLATWMAAGRDDVRFASAVALWSMIHCDPDPVHATGWGPVSAEERLLYASAKEAFDALREGPPVRCMRRGRPY